MNRRNALKNIGIGAGITVSAGTLASLLSGCNADPIDTWTPEYFTISDANILDELSDIILPKTDTPGAKEAKVVRYMDMIVKNLYKEEDQENFNVGFAGFKERLKSIEGVKTEMVKVDEKEVEKITASRAQLEGLFKTQMEQLAANEDKPAPEEKPDPKAEGAANNPYFMDKFVKTFRSLSIAGYFGSELIGENHLVYEPVPGPYVGNIPLSDTGGKSYSL